MSYRMSEAERQAFLAGLHVAVLSLSRPGGAPLAVPIWYAYEPGGDLWFVTERDSRKGRLLAEGSRVGLCVQTEVAPYKYVSVEGPVTAIVPADVERDTRPLAHRYLGVEGGDRYVETTGGAEGHRGSVRVTVSPERWLTVDYAKAWSTAATGGE